MHDNDIRESLTARNFAIRGDQEAMLIQIAKDDDRSVSGALRYILDDWLSLKRAALQAATPTEAEPDDLLHSLHHTSLAVTQTYVEEQMA